MIRKILFSIFLSFLFFSFVSSWTSTEPIQVLPEGVSCNRTASYAAWINTSWEINSMGTPFLFSRPIVVVFNSSGNVGNCSLYSSPFSIENSCCPISYNCNSITGVCSRGTDNLNNYCDSLKTKEECEGPNSLQYGNLTMWELNVEGKELCGESIYISQLCLNHSFCECYWNSGNCSFRRRFETICFDPVTGNPSSSGSQTKKCEYYLISREDKCSDIKKVVVSYGARKVPPNADILCNPFEREFDCSDIVTLPFFSFINFVLSVLFIALIYLFLRRY
ncbi:MAG: hypothetical protein QW103_00695 [Candidatus Pacearchaeota archaeon]